MLNETDAKNNNNDNNNNYLNEHISQIRDVNIVADTIRMLNEHYWPILENKVPQNAILLTTSKTDKQTKGFVLTNPDIIHIFFYGVNTYLQTFYQVFFVKQVFGIETLAGGNVKNLIDDTLSALYKAYQNSTNKPLRIYITGYSLGSVQAISHALIFQSLINHYHNNTNEFAGFLVKSVLDYLVDDIKNDDEGNNEFRNKMKVQQIDLNNTDAIRNALENELKSLMLSLSIEYVIAVASPNMLSQNTVIKYNKTIISNANNKFNNKSLKDITYHIHAESDSIAGIGDYRTVFGFVMSLFSRPFDRNYPAGKVIELNTWSVDHTFVSYSKALAKIQQEKYINGYEVRRGFNHTIKLLPLTTITYCLLHVIFSKDAAKSEKLAALYALPISLIFTCISIPLLIIFSPVIILFKIWAWTWYWRNKSENE
jgi:hypothetical protein